MAIKIIIIEILLLVVLLGISRTQACGCACGAPFFGIKSYITQKSYPSVQENDVHKLNTPDAFQSIPCPCACQLKLRFPIEILPIYLLLAILMPRVIIKRNR